jgi:hypothetical protein
MEDIMSMVINDESPSEISSKIKEILQAKAMEKIQSVTPHVSAGMFFPETEVEEG